MLIFIIRICVANIEKIYSSVRRSSGKQANKRGEEEEEEEEGILSLISSIAEFLLFVGA